MIEKTIKAITDSELKTCFGFHYLVEGEVKRIQFKSQKAFEALLQLGSFVEAGRDEKETKNIPVILPKVDEEAIVAVEPEEKPTVEELEGVLNGPEVPIEVMSDGSIQPEGIDHPEDSPIVHDMESIANTPMAGRPIENLPNDVDENTEHENTVHDEEPPSVLETGTLPEVEEIPVEEQDESKPELMPGESVDN